MDQSNMCNNKCQQSFRTLLTILLTVAESFPGSAVLPGTIKPDFVTDSVGCMCGEHMDYATLMTHIDVGGYIRVIENIMSDNLTLEIFTMVGRLFDFLFSSGFLCGGTCPSSVALGIELGSFLGWRAGLGGAQPELQRIGLWPPGSTIESLAPPTEILKEGS